MSGQPEFALSFDPRALIDLLPVPGEIRRLALEQLQGVVNADISGDQLTGETDGIRVVDVGQTGWVLFYGHHPAPPTSAYPTEIHVVAVLPQAGDDGYGAARARLARARRPTSTVAHAARSRSPQLTYQGPATAPRPHGAAPRLALPAPSPLMKGPLR